MTWAELLGVLEKRLEQEEKINVDLTKAILHSEEMAESWLKAKRENVGRRQVSIENIARLKQSIAALEGK